MNPHPILLLIILNAIASSFAAPTGGAATPGGGSNPSQRGLPPPYSPSDPSQSIPQQHQHPPGLHASQSQASLPRYSSDNFELQNMSGHPPPGLSLPQSQTTANPTDPGRSSLPPPVQQSPGPPGRLPNLKKKIALVATGMVAAGVIAGFSINELVRKLHPRDINERDDSPYNSGKHTLDELD